MTLKIKRANSEIKNILGQVDDLESLAKAVIRHSKKLKKIIGDNKEIIDTKGINQALCEAGAKHLMPIHSYAASLHARSWMCHNRLEDYILPGVDEGNKDCP